MSRTEAALRAAVDNAQEPGARRVTVVEGPTLSLRPVEWLERGQIPASALTLIAGMGGEGKSTLAAGYAARATRGRFAGKYAEQPINVLWVGNEDGREDVVGPRLRAAGADFALIGFVTLDDASLGQDINVVGDIDALRLIIVEREAKVIVVDPVVEFLPASTDSHNDMSVRHALRPLRNLASKLGVAVLGLVHLNKGDTLDVAARITGSGAFRNIARSVLVVAEYPERDGWRVVFQNKSNLGTEDGRGRLYQIEGAEYTDLEGRPVYDSEGLRATTGRVVWGEWVELDPYSLPAREAEHATPKRDDAKDMLRALLKDGPRQRSWIEEQAKLEAISWHTVERAKGEERIEAQQSHVPGKRGAGVSWWGLPGTNWKAFRSAILCLPDGGGPNQRPETLFAPGDRPPDQVRFATLGEAEEPSADLFDRDEPNTKRFLDPARIVTDVADPDHGLKVAEARAEEARGRKAARERVAEATE